MPKYSQRHNELKGKQLGMGVSMAQKRLYRVIMLNLAKKCGMDKCFRCGISIDDVNELSVDHKEPWFRVSNDLFWGVSNIAFSHHRCNSGDKRHPAKRPWVSAALRKQGEPGTAWCSTHRDFIPIAEFGLNNSRWNGVNSECTECRKKTRSPKMFIKRHPESEADGKPGHC